MNYMYHRVPDQMVGTTLYPLHQLRTYDPPTWEIAIAKYAEDPVTGRMARPQVLIQKINLLDCLWNDVIFSSAVHPRDLVRAWVDSGRDNLKPVRMFEIPLDRLDHTLLAIFEMRVQPSTAESMNREIVPYNPETYAEYTHVSEQARKGFAAMSSEKVFWLFKHIPHVLYRGTIDTADLNIIEVTPSMFREPETEEFA